MKKIMNKLILIVPVLIVLILTQAFTPVPAVSDCYPPLANMYPTQISSSGKARSYAINNHGHVVWQDAGYESGIWLYNGTTSTKLSNMGGDVQINDNDYVVWVGGSFYAGIFLYNGTTVTRLTNSSDAQLPKINNNNYVVWEGYDGSDWEIFLYNGTTITQLTNNSYDDIAPQINNNGYVVWSGHVGTNSEIFLYDGTSITQLTNGSYTGFPQISDNGYVVWRDYVDILLYNGTTITNISNCNEDTWTTGPQINDKGFVVWLQNDRAFLYDGTATTEIKDISTWTWFYDTLINDKGDVVLRGGPVVCGEYFCDVSDFNIYLARAISEIKVIPTSHYFEGVQVGSSSVKQTFTITNAGTAYVIIGTITVTGTNASEFSTLNDSCSGQTLAPADSCTIDAVFSPTSTGTKTASLYIRSDFAPTVTVPLYGASAPVCQCNLVPDATVIPRGGTLGIQVTLTNNTDQVQVFKFATRITKPSGGKYPATGYLKGPLTVRLDPHGSMSRHLSQYVPNTAPLGTYTYHGYVGVLGNIYDECQFQFTVTQ